VQVVGVAKGTTRKAGFETLILGDSGVERQLPRTTRRCTSSSRSATRRTVLPLPGTAAAGRSSASSRQLESIPGVGAKRRRELLRHFGSAGAVRTPAFEELRKISGISANMAQTIYDHLHGVAD
jgi:excinuclease ABC subunit C